MVGKVDSILNEVLEKVKPSGEELKFINGKLEEFIKQFNLNARKLKIKAESFVGGSFAKDTVIKKDYYDVDVFIRFDKVYNEEKISEFTARILKKFSKNFKTIHGSRDYFRVEETKVSFTKSSFKLGVKPNPSRLKFFIEIIPVMKVDKPTQALNITDLSYSHVKYVKRKAKGKTLEGIRLAKAFCHANKCYGAESYINGFSGYSLELLICYYGSFLKMVRAFAKADRGKIVIDIERKYKTKNMIMIDVNSSKLMSPIILIDPTFKQRNAAAALSKETFERFKKACKKFLKNPSVKSFEVVKTDLEKVKKNALKNKNEFILLEAMTKKQEGDVAGSKLMKFHNHLTEEIERYFVVKNKGFNYNDKKAARMFFVVKSKKEIVLNGPMVVQKDNVKKFKKAHKRTFVKRKKVYAKEKVGFDL